MGQRLDLRLGVEVRQQVLHHVIQQLQGPCAAEQQRVDAGGAGELFQVTAQGATGLDLAGFQHGLEGGGLARIDRADRLHRRAAHITGNQRTGFDFHPGALAEKSSVIG